MWSQALKLLIIIQDLDLKELQISNMKNIINILKPNTKKFTKIYNMKIQKLKLKIKKNFKK